MTHIPQKQIAKFCSKDPESAHRLLDLDYFNSVSKLRTVAPLDDEENTFTMKRQYKYYERRAQVKDGD